MLALLKIRNLALVDELHWEIGNGLIGVTGETGAGKSVIIGALKLVLGERADKSLIRSGEDNCTVEAVFEPKSIPSIQAILEESGISFPGDEALMIRRVISTASSRQFVNDSPVTLATLKKLGEELVDLHGPHDHQSLLSTDRQLSMLDAYANHGYELENYRECYRRWRLVSARLDELEQEETAGEQELDLLKHLVREIDEARLEASDEQELEERWRRASNATRLLEGSANAMEMLSGDDGVFTKFMMLQKTVRDMERLDPSLREWSSPLEKALLELEDLESAIRGYIEELDTDPEEAERIEHRMNLVESLRRKYGPSLDDIKARRDKAAERLDTLENRDSKIDELRSQLAEARSQLDAASLKLTRGRRRAAPKLAKEIASQLTDLGFKQSCFEIHLPAAVSPGPHGAENSEFMFGPNPGEPTLPLRQIASSGEISRVMLAIKSALAGQDSTPLMVFDEIDANVGGEIASAVGRKMANLGKRHQVVAITHFPQVAAKADQHFVVQKEVSDGRTRSRLFAVRGDSRIDELVRMLGGGGEKARAMAEALLDG